MSIFPKKLAFLKKMNYTTRSIEVGSRPAAGKLNFHAVIPSYNVADRLDSVLLKISEILPSQRIWVVDDGSEDGTDGIARAYKIQVIRHDRNRGKGAALKSGFKACIDAGAEAVLTLDGDGQHDPAFIPSFIRLLIETDCDLVVGLREMRRPDMPLDRIFSNRTSSLITSIAAGRRIPDSQCGFRLYRRAVLTRIRPETDHYEMETEMLILAARAGFRMGWCPVRTSYDGQTSHIRRLNDTARFLRLIGRFF